MIKVLELIDGGFVGGGQLQTLSLCRNFNRDLIHPVVCASPYGGFKEAVISQGFDFQDIILPKILRMKYLKDLKKIIESESIDIIHAHGGVAGMYARFYNRKYGDKVKVIHTLHGIHYIHSKNILRRKLSLYIEQYLSDNSDAYICETNSDLKTASDLRIINPLKATVIYNGIDLNKFHFKTPDVTIKKEFGISDKDFIIGNISRFDEQKNQKLLVKVMPYLIKQIPEVKLLLIGDGYLMESVKKLSLRHGIEDKIIFAGTRVDLYNIYSVMDIFVFPSLWEGLSLTLLEALATGSCIVAGNIPSNKEIISHNENGMLFDLHDKNDIIEKTLLLYKNKNIRTMLSENAVKSSVRFDEKSMVEKTEKLYLKLINR